jgi:hypothetical protein
MCIQNKPRLGFLFVVMLLTTVIVLAGCTDLELTEENAPLYTPIVILPESTDLPTEAALISLEELSAQPEKYADRFVEVHGLNAGVYARPACSPYIGPPTEWLLFAEPTIYKDNVAVNAPARIQVKNTFGGIISDPSDPLTGYAVRNTRMKQVAVWGWVRLYEGGVGCIPTDLQGTPIPPPTQRIWYIDAVKLQFLESIEPTH